MQNYIQYINEFHEGNQTEIDFINKQLRSHLKTNPENQTEIEHILDFLYSNPTKSLSKLGYQTIKEKADKWTIKLQSKESKDNEQEGIDYDTFLDFKDGFKIVILKSESSYIREGKLMSHCVGSYYNRGKTIYSLRDANNKPHCTIEEGQQIKGKGNGAIDTKYIDYIVKFLEHTGMTVGENEMKNLGYYKLDKIDTGLTSDSLYKGYIYQGKLDTIKDSDNNTYKGFGLFNTKDIVEFTGDFSFKLHIDIPSLVEYFISLFNNIKSTGKSDEKNYKIGSSGDSAKIGSSGDYAQIGSSGDYAQIGSSGDYAKIGSSGYYAKIGSSGYYAQIGSSGYYAQIGSSGYSAKIGSSGYYAQIGSSGYSAQIGSSGYSAKIGSSGDYAKIGSSGYYAKIGSSGYSAQINIVGQYSIGSAIGYDSKIKGIKGTWIVLAEYENKDGKYIPKLVKTAQIDGTTLKENTFYQLINGEFTEVDE